MGRSIYCSKCKLEKEPGRDKESCCKKCKSEARSARLKLKRELEGKQPWGSGRSPHCSKCKGLKEHIESGYCNKCALERERKRRIEKGITTLHCECGNLKASARRLRCDACQKEKNLQKYREDAKKYRESENGYKEDVRKLVAFALRRNLLKKQPCEICATTEKVEAHHDDYSKPLEVRWLCQTHHQEHHKNDK